MTEGISQSERRNGKPAVLLGIGLVVGTAIGLSLGGTGLFSRKGETVPQKSANGAAAVTFKDGTKSEGQGGGALDELLDTGNAGGFDHTRNVMAYVDGLKPGDLAGEIDTVFAQRRGNQGYVLINSLYQKWVEQDPAGNEGLVDVA